MRSVVREGRGYVCGYTVCLLCLINVRCSRGQITNDEDTIYVDSMKVKTYRLCKYVWKMYKSNVMAISIYLQATVFDVTKY